LADKNILIEVVIVFAKWLFLVVPETFLKVKGKDAAITVFVLALKEINFVVFILLLNLPKSFFIEFGYNRHRTARL
jgi:hypothetical protein